MLELHASKGARAVLRGGGAGDSTSLPDYRKAIVLCRLDPLLRDMVRITHLDRVFEICGDEAEAVSRMLRALARRLCSGLTAGASFVSRLRTDKSPLIPATSELPHRAS